MTTLIFRTGCRPSEKPEAWRGAVFTSLLRVREDVYVTPVSRRLECFDIRMVPTKYGFVSPK